MKKGKEVPAPRDLGTVLLNFRMASGRGLLEALDSEDYAERGLALEKLKLLVRPSGEVGMQVNKAAVAAEIGEAMDEYRQLATFGTVKVTLTVEELRRVVVSLGYMGQTLAQMKLSAERCFNGEFEALALRLDRQFAAVSGNQAELKKP